MPKRPSVLDDYAAERNVDRHVKLSNYSSEADSLCIEDETGRAQVIDCAPCPRVHVALKTLFSLRAL